MRFPDHEDCEHLARIAMHSSDWCEDHIVQALNLTVKAIHARFHIRDEMLAREAVESLARLVESELGPLPERFTFRHRLYINPLLRAPRHSK